MRKLLIPLALWAAPVSAWAQDAAPPPALTGHYYLEGVMETGSELLLLTDGKFQWYLSVGALDLFAEGTWASAGDKIVLTAAKDEKAPPPGFETLELTVGPNGLIPPDGKGAYVKHGEAPPPEPEAAAKAR